MVFERPIPPDPYDFLPPVASFAVTSDDVDDGGSLTPARAHPSAGGDNVSPHLRWSGAPDGTKGYAVTAFDPDAPTGSGAWHWILLDLPSSVTELPQGVGSAEQPSVGGFHARNDFGSCDYAGAAPPPGDRPHRYLFAVHALDTPALDVTASTSAAFIGFNLTAHTLGRAVLATSYQQPA